MIYRLLSCYLPQLEDNISCIILLECNCIMESVVEWKTDCEDENSGLNHAQLPAEEHQNGCNDKDNWKDDEDRQQGDEGVTSAQGYHQQGDDQRCTHGRDGRRAELCFWTYSRICKLFTSSYWLCRRIEWFQKRTCRIHLHLKNKVMKKHLIEIELNILCSRSQFVSMLLKSVLVGLSSTFSLYCDGTDM